MREGNSPALHGSWITEIPSILKWEQQALQGFLAVILTSNTFQLLPEAFPGQSDRF